MPCRPHGEMASGMLPRNVLLARVHRNNIPSSHVSPLCNRYAPSGRYLPPSRVTRGRHREGSSRSSRLTTPSKNGTKTLLVISQLLVAGQLGKGSDLIQRPLPLCQCWVGLRCKKVEGSSPSTERRTRRLTRAKGSRWWRGSRRPSQSCFGGKLFASGTAFLPVVSLQSIPSLGDTLVIPPIPCTPTKRTAAEMEWGTAGAETLFEDKDGRCFLPARMAARVVCWVRPRDLIAPQKGELTSFRS